MRLSRAELVAKAVDYFEKNCGKFKSTGERHVRETLTVYFATVGTSENEACIEITVDAETGDLIRVLIGPEKSILESYDPESRPAKPSPN